MHGDVVVLGASSWRVERHRATTGSREPAPGVPGKLPFWHGDAVGPAGRARPGDRRVHRASRGGPRAGRDAAGRRRAAAAARASTTSTSSPPRTSSPTSRTSARRPARCRPTGGSSSSASATSSATGGSCILTPFGGRVHAPWTLALEARLAERLGLEVQTIWSDDGIAIRLPEGDGDARRRRGAAVPRPRRGRGPGRRTRSAQSALFASASARTRPGRCCSRAAGPAPGRRCGSSASGPRTCSRSPAATAASRSSSRRTASASSDVFDLPALREVLGGVAAARDRRPQRRDGEGVAVRERRCCSTTSPPTCTTATRRSPSDGRRRSTLDRDLLRELLGQEELRELLDPDALADLELSLQALADDRQATTADQVHDLLRRLGDLSADEVAARTVEGGVDGRRRLARRADALAGARSRSRIGGEERWIAMEDVARYRDGVGVSRAAGRAAGVPRPGRRRRSTGCWRAGRGPTARSWRRSRRGAGGCRSGVVEDALDRLVARRDAAPRRVPARRRRARVVRPGGAAAAAPAVAREAAARGRAGRPGRARPVPARVAGRRRRSATRRDAAPRDRPRWSGSRRSSTSSPGLPIPASRPRARRPAGPGPGLPAAAPRRAGRDGRGRVGRAREPGPRRRAGRALSGRVASSCGRRASPDGVDRPERSSTSAPGAPPPARRLASTASCSRGRRRSVRIARCSTRCGTSCGPARSPTTPSPRCARCAGSGPAQ